MRVKHILSRKGSEVITTSPDITLEDAARLLKHHHIGALVVADDERRVQGIISERDIINAIAEHGPSATALPVREIMTREVCTCTPDDDIDRLMQVMTNHRVRHLPIVENGHLAGLVSIGDVVKQRMDEIAFEAEQMKLYIVS